MGVFDNLTMSHEQVVVRHDAELGLTAIVALHSTVLGPAAGGCRCWRYPSLDAAVVDALRLSQGMTFKNAIARIGFGGGKSVIVAPEHGAPSRAQLHRFGDWVEDFGGRYVTAEDVGMGVPQMAVVAERTRYVSGLGRAGAGGDPSPHTALGVLRGIEAAVRYQRGARDLTGLTVAVQGLGNVGMRLCALLHGAGAHLVVADPQSARTDHAARAFGARIVSPERITSVRADVLAPCALGGVLDDDVVANLQATIVAGAANNQLATAEVGDRLLDRGILYAPDYVINAGGVISIADEYMGRFDPGTLRRQIDAIYDRTLAVFAEADAESMSTSAIADRMARRLLAPPGPDADGRCVA